MKPAWEIVGETVVDVEPGAAIAGEAQAITPDNACHEVSLSRE
ncbi:hypothetical protein D083_1813 [Dickeya solani RNS 08.23.3.1.A]|nr:hypothetical protein D083_1813 [Dickeya solani RNS 08.23.3.1.A]